MNSFRFLERGIEAEIERQERILGEGGEVEQETLHFDPRERRADLAALEGGGARLPLLPRARPGAAGADRGDARARARGAARAAGGARRAPRARARPAAEHGAAARLPHRAGRLLRGGARRRTASTRASSPTGVNDLVAALGDRDPGETKLEPAAFARLVALVADKQVVARARQEVLALPGRSRAASRRAIVERGLGVAGARRAGRDRRPRDRRQRRRRREDPGRQGPGDRRDRRRRDARDQGPRRRRRGPAADPRAARG